MMEERKRRRNFEQPVLFSHLPPQAAPAPAAPRRETVQEKPSPNVSPEELLLTRWTVSTIVAKLDLLAPGEQLAPGQIGDLMKRHANSVARGDYKSCVDVGQRQEVLAKWLATTLPRVGAKLKTPHEEPQQPRRRHR